MDVCPKSVLDVADGSKRTLPYRKPQRTWAGYGSGERCDLCSTPIGPKQIEYEVELSLSAPGRTLHLHFDCYQKWALQE